MTLEVAVGKVLATTTGDMEIFGPSLVAGEVHVQVSNGREVVTRLWQEVVREAAASATTTEPDLVPDRDVELLHYATPAERAHIDEWERHVLDVRDGRPPNPDGPTPYDSATSIETDRVATKTKELGLKRGEMRRKMNAYTEKGRRAFVHGNKRLPGDVLEACDPAVLAVLRSFVEREQVRSKKGQGVQYSMVLAELRQRRLARSESNPLSSDGLPLPEAHTLLPEKLFKAVVRALRRGSDPANDAKTAQSQGKRPRHGPVKHRALEFGDVVEIDSTPCDFQVWGPDGPQKVHAVLAVDVATRYPWIRLTLGPPRGLDVALLLHDMLNPQPLGSLAPQHALTTTPHVVRVNAWPPHAGAAPPALLPGCIVLDHGTEGENTHFIGLLAQLGIQIEWARTMTPTDKAHIESLISNFAGLSQVIPGHKGNAVKNRPERLHGVGLPTFRAVASMFRLWTFYAAAQPHFGLPHGLQGKRFLSPNEALLSSLARRTPTRLHPYPELFMRFLPSIARVPSDGGVDWDKVAYWCEDYEDLVVHASAAGGTRQRLTFHMDPYDTSRIFWNEPNTHQWRVLYAPGGDGLRARPFEDIQEALLKEIPGSRRPTKTHTAVERSYLIEEFLRIQDADEAAPHPAPPPSPTPLSGVGAFEVSSGGWDLRDLETLSITASDLDTDADDEPW